MARSPVIDEVQTIPWASGQAERMAAAHRRVTFLGPELILWEAPRRIAPAPARSMSYRPLWEPAPDSGLVVVVG